MSARKPLPPRFATWEPVVGRVAEVGPDAFVLVVEFEGANVRRSFALDPETQDLAKPPRLGELVRVLAAPLGEFESSRARLVRWVESAESAWTPERPPRPRRPRPTPGQLGMFGGEVRP